MYHYTYLIRHKQTKMKYIGVRSCKCLPKDDISYWGSSKYLPKNPQNSCQKRILRVFLSRKNAVTHEIWLHNKYDVAANPVFYNRAKQTALNFDTSGIRLTEQHKQKCSTALKDRVISEEHKQKISKALTGKKKSEAHIASMVKVQKQLAAMEGYKNPMQDTVMPSSVKNKISAARKASGSSKGIKNSKFVPWFITVDNVTWLFYDITKDEQSLLENFPKHTYRELCKRSKGFKKIVRGPHAGKIVGNIPVS